MTTESEEIVVDIGSFEFRDGIDFEDATKTQWMSILDGQKTMSMTQIAALVWLAKRKKDPTLTFEDALKLDLNTLTKTRFVGAGGNPTA